jgi:hypothetical protein
LISSKCVLFFVTLKNENFSNIAIAIAIVGRAITLEGESSKKKQRLIPKRIQIIRIRIKSDNFTRSKREKFNIAIAILEK